MGFIKRTCRFLTDRRKHVKTAAVILTIAAALLFSGAKGENAPVEIIKSGADEVYSETEEDVKAAEAEKKIFCDIGGEVINPGVYELNDGARLYELIDLAGGLTEDADTSMINRAALLYDGVMIRIPSESEAPMPEEYLSPHADYGIQSSGGLININTAGIEELQDIPGIGPVIAGRIIEHRQHIGYFGSIEEIKTVKGIGDKTFEKIKDHICI